MPGSQFNPMPRGPGDLERRIRDLERLVMEQAAARTLENATIGAGGLTIQGGQLVIKDTSGNVLATLDSTGLNITGSATIGGPTTISGATTVSGTNGIQSSNYVAGTSGWKFNGTSLEANTGVIGNGALANPVSPVSAHADGTNFSLATGANVDKLTITVSVPSGYSQALIFAGATMNARNTTASLDYAYLAVRINSVVSGWAPLSTTTAGTYCMVSAMGSRLLTGLGSSFTITAAASTSNAAWAADSTNVINLDAIVTFLR